MAGYMTGNLATEPELDRLAGGFDIRVLPGGIVERARPATAGTAITEPMEPETATKRYPVGEPGNWLDMITPATKRRKPAYTGAFTRAADGTVTAGRGDAENSMALRECLSRY